MLRVLGKQAIAPRQALKGMLHQILMILDDLFGLSPSVVRVLYPAEIDFVIAASMSLNVLAY